MNVKNYKLMVDLSKNVLWNVYSNKKLCNIKYLLLNKKIKKQLKNWRNKKQQLDKEWLNNDIHNSPIFEIKSEINREGLELCFSLSRHLYSNVYYWFDVERTLEENYNFEWEKCPIDGCKLEKTDFYWTNRFICRKHNILFPSHEQ